MTSTNKPTKNCHKQTNKKPHLKKKKTIPTAQNKKTRAKRNKTKQRQMLKNHVNRMTNYMSAFDTLLANFLFFFGGDERPEVRQPILY